MATKKKNERAVISLPQGCKPSKAVGTDKMRPILCDPWLRRTKDGGAELCVTNSYIAVRIPVRVDEGDPAEGAFPVEPLKLAERKRKDRQLVVENGHVEVDAGRVLYRRPTYGEKAFPDLENLWPKEAPKKPFRVGLNAKLLHELAQALGSDTVSLEFDLAEAKDGQYLRTILAKGLKGERLEGLLMPVRLNV